MVNGLVDPSALVDAAQGGKHVPVNAGLLGDFSDRGLFRRFALFDMALGKRPDHSPAPVHSTYQGGQLLFARAVDSVDDKSARRDFVNRAQPCSLVSAGPTDTGNSC